MNVTLPDGTVLEGVPDGTTRAELLAKLSANGYDVRRLMTECPRLRVQTRLKACLQRKRYWRGWERRFQTQHAALGKWWGWLTGQMSQSRAGWTQT